MLEHIEGHDATHGARQDRKQPEISSNYSQSRHSILHDPQHRLGEVNRNRTCPWRSDKRPDALGHIQDRAPAHVAGIAPPGHRGCGGQARASGDRRCTSRRHRRQQTRIRRARSQGRSRLSTLAQNARPRAPASSAEPQPYGAANHSVKRQSGSRVEAWRIRSPSSLMIIEPSIGVRSTGGVSSRETAFRSSACCLCFEAAGDAARC